MSDPNQPDPNQPVSPPPPPSAYPPPPAYPAPPPAYTPPPAYGQPQYGQPQYGQYQQPVYGAPSPYAHWGLRFAGYLLDSLLVLPGYVIGEIGFAVAGSTNASNGAITIGTVVGIVGLVGTVGFMIWNQFIRQGRTGQSLGKKWMRIKLVGERTGRPIGGWSVFGRGFVHILDALPCYIGFLWPLWDEKHQTFADKIMNTVVVLEPKDGSAPYTPPPLQAG